MSLYFTNIYKASYVSFEMEDEFLQEAKEYLESHKREYGKRLKNGEKTLYIKFEDLSEYTTEIAEALIDRPEETIQLLEVAAEEIEWIPKDIRIRFSSMSTGQEIKIKNIRAKHLGKMIKIVGVVKRASMVRPQAVNAKFECPSCLPMGTKIMTPEGIKNIEDVDVVHSVDKNFNIINKKVNVIKTKKKRIWEISTVYKSLYSSKDHKWIVYRSGMTLVIQTKDIKIGDIIYGINNNEVQSVREENTKRTSEKEKKNMQVGLQKDSRFFGAEEWGKNKDRHKADDKIIPEWLINSTSLRDIVYESQVNKEKVNKVWDYNKNLERTVYDICEKFKYVQAWKKMWGERIQESGKGELQMDMQQVWRNKEQDEGSFGSSQGWKSFQQFSGEFRSAMRFVPYEVTSIRETEEEVEMYDLQVPDTNNFILEGGVITHNCGTIISVLQIEKNFKEPSRCSCGRKGSFKELSKDLIDFQLLSIEELQRDSGGQPEKIQVLLKEDLVSPENRSKSIPGTEVEIIGILKELPIMNNGGKLQTHYDLMLEANNIISLEEDKEDLQLTEEEEQEIRDLAKCGNILEKITTSMAPSIKGHRDVKKTLALQLFGGVRSIKKDGTTRRGDIHCLLVGDPSCGKSVLLSFVNNISPKCKIVAGKSTSTAGLIGGAVMDDILKCWSIEAGAMAMMNGGCLVIDEFEKVNEEDRSSLHQAMEQQQVTIQKIVSATLKTETSILAAANPKWGRFNPEMDLGKQINMIPSLLSRFDAIFIMRDIPNEEKDSDIADMVLDGYDEEELDIIDSKLLKKYIAYARQHIKPKLNEASSRAIKNYYIKMRGINENRDAIPIGTRQLEGMVRLAQAHARMRLSNTATDQDARVAIGAMSDYLKKMGFDEETNSFDIDKISGNSASQRSKIDIIKKAIKKLGEYGNKLIPMDAIYLDCKDSMTEDEYEIILDKIITAGDIFRPKRGFIQVM